MSGARLRGMKLHRGSSMMVFLCSVAFAQQPVIVGITPSQGPVAGGTVVSIKGTNLAAAIVKLDGVPIPPLAQSDTEVRLQMPRHDNGYAALQIGKATAEFVYVPPKLEELPAGYITTVAGVGTFVREYGPATESMASGVGIAYSTNGALYVASPGQARVYRVVDGMIERFAGIGTSVSSAGGSGDGGDARNAYLSFPRSVAIDGDGNCYIPDVDGRIRKVGPDGIISTIAGDGTRGFSGDGGPARLARVDEPSFMAVDADDIFFIDANNLRIRRIHRADGFISTIAGTGERGFSGDGGPSTQAKIDTGDPDRGSLTLASNGDVYFLDAGNRRVRKIDRHSGIIDTVYVLPPGDGAHGTGGIALDSAGNLYVSLDGEIRVLDSSGRTIATYGQAGIMGFSEDGTPAASARYGQIQTLTVDPTGSIVYSDNSLQTVRRINRATGRIETLVGMAPRLIGETGPALRSVFTVLGDIDFAPDGRLLVANPGEYRLRAIDRDGNISTIAGNGASFGPAEGARATTTGLVPLSIFVRPDGALDLTLWMWVWELPSDGTLHKVAGRDPGCPPISGDGGPARAATLCQPFDAIRDRDGNLFIADTNNNRIRRVDARTGVMTTFAGNGGPVNGFENWNHGQYCGDGGPAFNACLNTPLGLAFDPAGNLYVSETYSGRIRRIDRFGTITTFAHDVFVTQMKIDAAGFLYGVNVDRVVRLDPSGKVTVLVGGNGIGFSGDGGPALAARINDSFGQSVGVAIDTEGNLFFVDTLNQRIRAVRYGAVLAPPGATVRATAAGSAIRAIVVDANGAPAPSVRVDFAAPASGASCALSNPFAITDPNGVATVSCTSNCVEGTYSVSARPLTAGSVATVSLTNRAGPCRHRSVRH